MNFNDKAYAHITIHFGNQLVFMDCINAIRKIHLIFNSIFFSNGEWNIKDTEGKIYSACSQNFYLSNNLFFYMTFMNSLNRNDFNVNVILNKFKFKEKCLHILLRHKKQYFIYLSMLFVFLGNCSSNKSEWCNKIHKKI